MKLTLLRESLYFCVLHLNLLHSIVQIHIVEKQTNKHKTFPFPLSRGHCSPIRHCAPAVAAVQSEVPVEYTIGLLARYGRRPSSFPPLIGGGGKLGTQSLSGSRNHGFPTFVSLPSLSVFCVDRKEALLIEVTATGKDRHSGKKDARGDLAGWGELLDVNTSRIWVSEMLPGGKGF